MEGKITETKIFNLLQWYRERMNSGMFNNVHEINCYISGYKYAEENMKDKGDLEDEFWLGDFMNYIVQKLWNLMKGSI